MPNPDIPMGDRAISHLVSSLGSETNSAMRQIFPMTSFSIVGDEPRPDASFVIWVGPTRPAHMIQTDFWFNPDLIDSQAPTVPNGLYALNVTSTGFRMEWNPSSDNVDTTIYEVYLNGVQWASTSGTFRNFSNLTPETEYTVAVRARDDAGNWSALSESVSVTTDPPVLVVEHNLYGAGPYPTTLVKASELPSITVATALYTFGEGAGWIGTGARIYIPAGITVASTVTMCLWQGTNTSIEVNPDRLKNITNLTTGWNEVHWDEPIALTSGEYNWIGYTFNNGDYLYTSRSSEKIGQGLAEGSEIGGGGFPYRSQYQVAGSGRSFSAGLYGIDIIVQEP